MLVRLMYASRATGEINSEDLSAILRKSKANNPGQGITGVLCYSREGGVSFFRFWRGGAVPSTRSITTSSTTLAIVMSCC